MNTIAITPPSAIAPPSASVTPPAPRQRQNKTISPAPAAAPAKLVRPKAAASSAISDRTITIVATVNVGWGNSVYLRGEGGSLNWDMGVPMMCSGDDRWVWCCREDEAPRQFKFLRNDQHWASGGNHVLSGADIMVCNPTFPG